MITTVLLGLILAAAIACLVVHVTIDRTRRDGNEAYVVTRAAAIALFTAFVLLALATTFNHVKATEVGVPVSFGTVHDPLSPGVHFTAPWVSVETYPTRPLSVDSTVTVRTGDAGSVKVATTARWKVSVTRARELYFQSRTGDEERISNEIIARNLAQAVGDVYNTVSNVNATKRENRAGDIKTRLTQLVDQYGIDITAVNLRSVDPDATTARAIADFATQQRRTQIAVEANKTAVQEAARRLTEAKGLKDSAAQIPTISGAQAQALCVQAWERMVSAGHTIYASPCGGQGAVPTVAAK